MSREKRLFAVSMYNADGVWMRTDEMWAVSEKQACNNVAWRWRGVYDVTFRALEIES